MEIIINGKRKGHLAELQPDDSLNLKDLSSALENTLETDHRKLCLRFRSAIYPTLKFTLADYGIFIFSLLFEAQDFNIADYVEYSVAFSEPPKFAVHNVVLTFNKSADKNKITTFLRSYKYARRLKLIKAICTTENVAHISLSNIAGKSYSLDNEGLADKLPRIRPRYLKTAKLLTETKPATAFAKQRSCSANQIKNKINNDNVTNANMNSSLLDRIIGKRHVEHQPSTNTQINRRKIRPNDNLNYDVSQPDGVIFQSKSGRDFLPFLAIPAKLSKEIIKVKKEYVADQNKARIQDRFIKLLERVHADDELKKSLAAILADRAEDIDAALNKLYRPGDRVGQNDDDDVRIVFIDKKVKPCNESANGEVANDDFLIKEAINIKVNVMILMIIMLVC